MSNINIPTDFGPDSGGRVKGLTIVKAIVYGNVARSFLKKREEDGKISSIFNASTINNVLRF